VGQELVMLTETSSAEQLCKESFIGTWARNVQKEVIPKLSQTHVFKLFSYVLLNTVIRDELGNGGTCVSSIVGHVIESM
jgi:hypothetical protein